MPENWIAVPFGNISTIWNGRQYKKSEHKDSGTPVIRIQNLTGTTDDWIYSDLVLKEEKYCEKGDLLYSWSGTFTPNIWGGPRAIFHYHIWKIDLYDKMVQKYVFYLLEAISESLRDSSHGIMLPHMTKGGMQEWTIPLPPHQEQQRIVKKIETLLSQVDELEQKVQQDRLVDEHLQIAVLHDLQTAETPEASRQSWQRLIDHFEQIYRKPQHIDQLKQAILNEAVRGRLVSQDPSDEPAEKLLERIKEEKQRLYDEGKIRKPKEPPEIKDEEIPYKLPKGWTWERLRNLGFITGGGTPTKSRNSYWGEILFGYRLRI